MITEDWSNDAKNSALEAQEEIAPQSYVFRHFREYHNAYARFPLSVNKAGYVKYVFGYSPKWRKMYRGEEEWLSKLCYFCFLCAKKKDSGIVAKLKLSHWCQMDVTV